MQNNIINPLVVGTCVVPEDGGRPKTMNLFSQALSANIASFTPVHKVNVHSSGFENVTHAPVSHDPIRCFYGYAPKRDRVEVEKLASRASLLSCHVMLRYHANWVYKMHRKHNIPYWVVPHGQLDPYVYTYGALVKKTWMRFYGKRLLQNAAHVIFSTEREREKASWIHEGANTRVIHWPVDSLDTSGKADAVASVRERYKIKPDERILLYLGRVHQMKRPIETIKALSLSGVKDVHLFIVGPEEGVTAEMINQCAAQHGVGRQVHFVGPVYGEAKMEYLLGADGYVSLSMRENFNHTAAESLAAGKPVILSPGNDLAVELAEADCGWFLKTDQLEEAAHAIREFASTPGERLVRMGEQGRVFISDKCSFATFRANLLALHQEAVSAAAY